MKVKTRDLIGLALNFAVGLANGWVRYPTDSAEAGMYWHTNPAIAPHGYEHNRIHLYSYNPSTDPAQAYEIMDRRHISVAAPSWLREHWRAMISADGKSPCKGTTIEGWIMADGPTILIAAMRCYVAHELGDEIDIPEGLP